MGRVLFLAGVGYFRFLLVLINLKKYIKNEYIDSKNIPVKIDGALENKILLKAKKVLALQRKGVNLIFPDVLKIEQELLKNHL